MTDTSLWQTAPLTATIDHILERYHHTHRCQLNEILPLAEKVSRVHAGHVPAGLLPLLQHLQDELESHMQKEERILFPLIKQGNGRQAVMPVRVMMVEHDDHQHTLTQLAELTGHFQPPAGACGSWQRLYALLSELHHDLQQHIHLENDILFARALNE